MLKLAACFLLMACFKAWQDQYLRAEDESTRLEALSVPDFRPTIGGVWLAATPNMVPQGTFIFCTVTIMNYGAASGVADMKASVVYPSGEILETRTPAAPIDTIKLKQPDGGLVYFTPQHYFGEHSGEAIPRNGAIADWLFLFVKAKTVEEVNRGKLRLVFTDYAGKSYATERELGGNGNTCVILH